MSRIFVGDSFKASQMPVELYEFVRSLPDSVTVCLEFVSPGQAHRQIDVAVLGRGGIDVIELKRYRGVVTGGANGPWIEHYGGREQVISNRRGTDEENPYTQVQKSSDDFKEWVKRNVAPNVRSRGIVLFTPGNQSSVVEPHNFIKFANGVGDLDRLLLSTQHAARPYLMVDEIDRILRSLGLHELGAVVFHGVVQDAGTGGGLSGVQVQVEGIAEPLRTGRDGSFSFVYRRGETASIRILPPGGYHEYEVVEQLLTAEMRQYYQLRPLSPLDGVDALEARLIARIEEIKELVSRGVEEASPKDGSSTHRPLGSSDADVQALSSQIEELRGHLEALRSRRDDVAVVDLAVESLQRSTTWRSQQASGVDLGYGAFVEATRLLSVQELAMLVATLEKVTLKNVSIASLVQGASTVTQAVQSMHLGERARSLSTRMPKMEVPLRFQRLIGGVQTGLGRGASAAKRAAGAVGDSKVGQYASSAMEPLVREFGAVSEQIEERARDLRRLDAEPLRKRLGEMLLKRTGQRALPFSEAAYRSVLHAIAPEFGIQGAETYSTSDLARLVVDEAMRDLEAASRKRAAEMTSEERAAVIKELDRNLSAMSSQEQEAIARSLGVDRATGDVLFRSFAVGGLAFGTLAVAGSTGFGLYLAMTTVLHAVATTMFGVTLGFGVYTGLASTIAFLLSPLVVTVAVLGSGGAVAARRGPKVSRRVVAMALVQVLHRRIVQTSSD